MPFTGESWQHIIEDLTEEDERAALLYLSPYGSRLGHFTVKRPNARPLDMNCIALLRPSHTAKEIAELLACDGELWHVKAADAYERGDGPPPPEPNPYREYDQDQALLYDVFAHGRFLAALHTQVRLSLNEALHLGLALKATEHGILLRYAEPEDTLEWVNQQSTLEAKSPDQSVLPYNTNA